MSEETTTPEVVEEVAPVAEVVAEAAPVAEAKKEEVGADVEIPKEFKALVDQVEKMSVMELNTLVKLLEKKFGVSAAAVAVAGPAAGGAEEKSEFTVELTSDGGAKIPVMKVVKEVLGLGLKEAKDLVEALPAIIKEGAKKEEAEQIKAKLEEAGGKVTLK